jgi:glucosamine--fructose-6-phosphate aminotransferase (isomerizing)
VCGIFGAVSPKNINFSSVKVLAAHAERRGSDSSGFLTLRGTDYTLHRANLPVTRLLDDIDGERGLNFIMGHGRLVTNGLNDNQPVYRDGICVIHNGIIVNHEDLWASTGIERYLEIDTEIIPAIASKLLEERVDLQMIPERILSSCRGIVACALVVPKLGKLCLFSNNGSLYYGQNEEGFYFSSEEFPLKKLGLKTPVQVLRDPLIIDLAISSSEIEPKDLGGKPQNLIPVLGQNLTQERILERRRYAGLRCTRCILPATMPFIKFDQAGVCNYCHAYRKRNQPKSVNDLLKIVEPFRRPHGAECVVPFSGGRDSCFGLHLIVNELKMRPITYTYDWGMVTDLGRRNISRMCAQLGVENIIVAADIKQKRRNIAKNLGAWLKSPDLGMVSILTAGDKHFFKYVETVKAQTGVNLNLWGINPLEVTHFKAGFLGIPPDFEESRVYINGFSKQLRYQLFRARAMLRSLGYFNSSLLDTLIGEYYRSFHSKSDYFHIFDYWRWDEREIDSTLINSYEWETAPDTNTTWRIGDGTAAFYNYIYYTVAGFTEHDTFRSNQIREGDLTREEALTLVEDENRPRYPNIKWYLDAIGMNFEKVILTINSIPKLH